MNEWKLKNGVIVRHETEFGHSYELDGEFVVGVTTMLSKGVPPEAGLLEYFKRNDRQTQEDILLDAQERGTNVHQAIEQLLLGEQVHSDSLTREIEKKAVAAFIDFFLTTQPEFVVSEHVVAYKDDEYRFAGTLDFIATIKGKRVLIDFKTGANHSLKNELQVAAYKAAVEQSIDEKIDACYTLYLGTSHKGARVTIDKNGIPSSGLMWKLIRSNTTFRDVKIAYHMMLLTNGGKYPTPPQVIKYPKTWQLTRSEQLIKERS